MVKRLSLTLLALPVVVGAAVVAGAHANYGLSVTGGIDPSCTLSNACIEYDNNGSGPGVRGVSLLGSGLNGQTKFKSTSSANGTSGVLGNDLSISGAFDSGVKGISVRGTGLLGISSSGPGVSGSSSTAAGVSGIATGSNGLVGITKMNGTSSSNARSGVLGQDQSTSGTFNAGVTGTSVRGIGVSGLSTNHAGVQGAPPAVSVFLGKRRPVPALSASVTSPSRDLTTTPAAITFLPTAKAATCFAGITANPWMFF